MIRLFSKAGWKPESIRPSLLPAAPAVAISLLLQGCSLDIVPVHYSKVNSAKRAEQPLARGTHAPGAFTRSWKFPNAKGYLLDPTELEIVNGVVRLRKAQANAPDQARFGVIVTKYGAPYAALDSFSETRGPGHQGQIAYQLSHNNSAWYYFDGNKWVTAGPSYKMTNTALEINERITTFHSDVGSGNLFVKAFLISPSGKETAELKDFTIQGIAPRTDGWD